MKRRLLILSLFCSSILHSQDSSDTKNTLLVSGYLKELVWTRFDKNFSNSSTTNLIHNRVNLKWKPSEIVNGRLEVRNRFYWGDDVKFIPNFKHQLKNINEAANLSATWLGHSSIVLHSNVERLWLEYRKSKWNMRAGRQRINWGIANTWNPNDLFNTYNFLDFDYEERPGSDAVKMQYQVNDLSNLELAFAATADRPIAAVKYFTNYKKYDLQAIMGLYQSRFTTGIGWAGSISDVGFKGEAQFYADKKDSLSQLNWTMEADYIFKSGWYLSAAILYNQKGWHKPLTNGTEISFQTSPRNLMPSRWNLLGTTSKEFTPIFRGSINVIYSPGVNMLIFFPTLTYNLASDLDIEFVWQSFFSQLQTFQALSHTGYLRFKWSF